MSYKHYCKSCHLAIQSSDQINHSKINERDRSSRHYQIFKRWVTLNTKHDPFVGQENANFLPSSSNFLVFDYVRPKFPSWFSLVLKKAYI